ncbi:hypothetical protein CVT24_004564 [Panaeolus cyanescens]|uniref:Uncharacterized protein n=1 Tax=Panaeolus cyanescens TaxID=181874 RepID=A0A409VCC5_9AGAR|nr:hypothetical protein CVT24_004564 [Panaeolus cyanescens]
MSIMPHVATVLAALHPRKPRQRTTFVALLILVALSTYIFIAHSATLAPGMSHRRGDSAKDQLAHALETIQNSHLADINSNKHGQRKGHHHRPQVTLDSAQELAAVSSFLASLPQNVIPRTVDPSKPIDPQLILDFDTRGPRAQEEVEAMVDDIWFRNPVFLYSKKFSSVSREIKKVLDDLRLRPAVAIIDVDVRDDVDILWPMLQRITGQQELPILIIGGKVVGGADEVRALEKSGDLQKMITAAGSRINGAKKKKHRKH